MLGNIFKHKWLSYSHQETTEVRVPIREGLRYIVRWATPKENDIHAMVSIPIPSVIHMLTRIDALTEERDLLRDTLENARMG